MGLPYKSNLKKVKLKLKQFFKGRDGDRELSCKKLSRRRRKTSDVENKVKVDWLRTSTSKLQKQNLIYEIMRIVRENGSEFAYPSTSVYVESTPESSDEKVPTIEDAST